MNIPKYRAMKIDSDEYVTGLLDEKRQSDGTHLYYRIPVLGWKIDPSTLSINFPDMQDSENNPIFASLSEDGKGGDIIEIELHSDLKEKYIVYIENGVSKAKNITGLFYAKGSAGVYNKSALFYRNPKVIGIQE